MDVVPEFTAVNPDDEDFFILLLYWMSFSAACLAYNVLKTYKDRKPRRWWVRAIYENRATQGDFHNLVQEMRLKDTEMFFIYTRMTTEQFDELLHFVGHFYQIIDYYYR
ncbi:hypothetical protein ABEB36_015371 [Hypothenemus hampei]|uniref:Uncharacterized protein n=1 Tax=Hypothenemus hampei TaxID=57062 RepID=A0ABD1E4M5_HYPHA